MRKSELMLLMFAALAHGTDGGGNQVNSAVSGAGGVKLSSEPERIVGVWVYDYVGVSPSTLAQAKTVASHVLANVGVHLAWADCRIRAEDSEKGAGCDALVTPRSIQLRIIGRKMAERIGTTRDCLGYAWIANGTGSFAGVYYHRALELEKRNLASRAAILGYAIAHEIGHLLIGESRHSANGIMRPSWDDEELKRIAKGRLVFTPEQSQQIAIGLVKTAHASTGTPAGN